VLTNEQIEQFITNGYVPIEQAFPRELADKCREILWADTGCDPAAQSTWKKPVVWLGYYDQEPFVQAANTPKLHTAFDQIVGQGCWKPRPNIEQAIRRALGKSDVGTAQQPLCT
jgi:hypothetical protein